MPKATRKPGAGPIAPGWGQGAGHPDDELGFDWVPDAADVEDRLAHAAEGLRDNDARPLVKALLDLGLLPEAVRTHFQWWLDGKMPPYPKISTKDAYTLAAVRAYSRTPFLVTKQGKRRESSEQKAERVLDTQPSQTPQCPWQWPGMWRDGGVTAKLLKRVAGNKGREYSRIRNYIKAVGRFNQGIKPTDLTTPPKRKTPHRR